MVPWELSRFSDSCLANRSMAGAVSNYTAQKKLLTHCMRVTLNSSESHKRKEQNIENDPQIETSALTRTSLSGICGSSHTVSMPSLERDEASAGWDDRRRCFCRSKVLRSGKDWYFCESCRTASSGRVLRNTNPPRTSVREGRQWTCDSHCSPNK